MADVPKPKMTNVDLSAMIVGMHTMVRLFCYGGSVDDALKESSSILNDNNPDSKLVKDAILAALDGNKKLVGLIEINDKIDTTNNKIDSLTEKLNTTSDHLNLLTGKLDSLTEEVDHWSRETYQLTGWRKKAEYKLDTLDN